MSLILRISVFAAENEIEIIQVAPNQMAAVGTVERIVADFQLVNYTL